MTRHEAERPPSRAAFFFRASGLRGDALWFALHGPLEVGEVAQRFGVQLLFVTRAHGFPEFVQRAGRGIAALGLAQDALFVFLHIFKRHHDFKQQDIVGFAHEAKAAQPAARAFKNARDVWQQRLMVLNNRLTTENTFPSLVSRLGELLSWLKSDGQRMWQLP